MVVQVIFSYKEGASSERRLPVGLFHLLGTLGLWAITFSSTFAQSHFSLSLQIRDTEEAIIEQLTLPTNPVFKDSIASTLDHLLHQLQEKGYYAASVDQLVFQDSLAITTLYIGDRYNRFYLQNKNIPEDIWKKAELERYENRSLSLPQVRELKEQVLNYAENNGYPFAAIWLDDIQIDHQEIKAKLAWQSGPLIKIGALTIEEATIISPTYLQNYLDLPSGALFNKEKIETTTDKLQELPFLKVLRPPIALFEDDQATVHFFLETQPTNRFDFLLGVLPNNQETNKVLITADIDLAFQNQFGKGERWGIQFEQLRAETQQLQIDFAYPYLLNTPLGITLDFELYKRDTTYRDVNWRIGGQYQFAGNHYLSAFTQSLSTTLLSNMPAQTVRQTLPLATKYNAFGIAYFQAQLDNRLNPRKGWLLDVQGQAGFKNISIQEEIALTAPSLYDSLEQRSFQYRLNGQIAAYLPLQKRSTLLVALKGATILAEQPVFQNEQYRIGGARLLRGFDEQSIFASTYALSTIEYRYLVGRRSYFNVFSDLAWIDAVTSQDWRIGVGAGMAFETKAGIISISYALGTTTTTSFDFRQAKIHFGFINQF